MFDHESPSEDRFISFIHNYCDRWCERCRFRERCRVYDDEQNFRMREVLAGNDPDSDESMQRSMEESMGQAMQMLQQMADEMGVDLDDLPEDETSRADYDDFEEYLEAREAKRHPVYHEGRAWGERLHRYLKRMRADLPGVAEEVGARFVREYHDVQDEAALDLAGQQANEALERYKEALELLSRYVHLIPVKIARATADLNEDDDEEMRWDANGTAKLLMELLDRTIAALWTTAEFHRPWLEEVFSLTAGAEALKVGLDEAIPGHRTFVRPGFDEE